MGTIESYETSGGKRYRVHYRTPDRKQTDKRGFRTKREADLFLATVEVTKATGEYIEPSRSRTTVLELGVDWLEAKRSRLKPSSYRAIDDAWRVYVAPRWGGMQVSAITHGDVRTWVSQLSAGTAKTNRRDHIRTKGQGARPKSATVVIRAYGVLSAVLEVAVKDRRIPSNPRAESTTFRARRRSRTRISPTSKSSGSRKPRVSTPRSFTSPRTPACAGASSPRCGCGMSTLFADACR